jgi:hypothetical protein
VPVTANGRRAARGTRIFAGARVHPDVGPSEQDHDMAAPPPFGESEAGNIMLDLMVEKRRSKGRKTLVRLVLWSSRGDSN